MKTVTPKTLVREAVKAAAQAYCPYSNYPVGAALLAPKGEIFHGSNVENASYGLTLCAERVALVSAIAAGVRQFHALAIVAGGESVPYPCGACLQVLVEFCHPAMPVYVARIAQPARVEEHLLRALMPRAFRLKADDSCGPACPSFMY